MNDSNKKNIFPIVALRDIAAYPCVILPLYISRERSIAALDMAVKTNQKILLVPQLNPDEDNPDEHGFESFATFSRVIQMTKLADGRTKVLAEGISRCRVVQIHDIDGNYWGGEFEELENVIPATEETEVLKQGEILCEQVIEEFRKYQEQHGRVNQELINTLIQIGSNDLGRVADTISAHMSLEYAARLEILKTLNPIKRLELVFFYLDEEKSKQQLEEKIKKRVKKQMDKNHREYYLNEKIKAIQKELCELEGVENDFEKIENKIKEAKMPEEAEKKALSELSRLKQMSAHSSDAGVIRTYLETLISYPWSKSTDVQYDLEAAEAIFERDHYGLKDIKERILEYLAVEKRNPENKSPIICLVGPPGVGKTSIGRSIAEATGRSFERISLGGVNDEAEIRGHRRTYVAALPGKIVQKLCKLATNNPVILLDEIDKIGHTNKGDPASALLEVLDPAQNNTFSDHYLELDVDLSKVLFIATANTLNIPTELVDRMEIIRIPGYTPLEKEEIAKRYLLPRQIKNNAIKENEMKFSDDLIAEIIEKYTREAGVRNLEREIGKIARKAVRKLENSQTSLVEVNRENLDDFLGTPKYIRSDDDLKPKIGSVTGLAWTSVGGELLQIETAVFSGKGNLNHTGQLGDVMKESIQAALSVARQTLDSHDSEFRFSNYDIHLHLPEGATPKDGPSAGIAMTTALLSALTQKAVRGDIAMTGEITLNGRVLAIGGLKEKLLAAQRGKLKTVLIPKENVKDLRDIPDEVKDVLEIIPVSNIDEVFAQAFDEPIQNMKAHLPAGFNLNSVNIAPSSNCDC